MSAMNRRGALFLLASGIGWQLARAQSATAPYLDDVEFLLAEFATKAGPLLEIKHVDWKSVSEEFRKAARETQDDVAHVKLCNRLIARLRDGHAGILELKV